MLETQTRTQGLGWSILLIAAVLGVTATTVHAWEESGGSKEDCSSCGGGVCQAALGTVRDLKTDRWEPVGLRAGFYFTGPELCDLTSVGGDKFWGIKLHWGRSDFVGGTVSPDEEGRDPLVIIFTKSFDSNNANDRDGIYTSTRTDAEVVVSGGGIQRVTWANNGYSRSDDSDLTGTGSRIVNAYYADGTAWFKDSYNPSNQLVSRRLRNGTLINFSWAGASSERPTKVVQEQDGVDQQHHYYRYVETGSKLSRKISIEVVRINSSDVRVETTIEEYYTSGNGAGRLRFRLSPEDVNRLLASDPDLVGINTDLNNDGPINQPTDLETIADTALEAYASYRVTAYDSQGRVAQAEEGFGSACCGGGAGSGETHFVYGTNTAYPANPTPEQEHNVWKTYQGTEQVATGQRSVEFRNAKNVAVATVEQEMNAGAIVNRWIQHTVFDAEGRAVERRMASACTGYTYTAADGWTTGFTVDNAGTIGEVQVYEYDTDDNLLKRYARNGTSPAATTVLLSENTYQAVTYDGRTQHFLKTATTHYAAGDSSTTTYGYTFYQDAGVDTQAIETRTVTQPAVAPTQNGSGVAAVTTAHYLRVDDDGDGTYDRHYQDWTRDANGSLSYTSQNDLGQTLARIEDVDTDVTGDFSGLPAGWSNPDGAHLKTTYGYDLQGRQNQMTGPDGQRTLYAFSVIREVTPAAGTDPAHERTDGSVTLVARHATAGGDYSLLPISVSVSDAAGRTRHSVSGVPTTTNDGDLGNDWDPDATHITSAFKGTLLTRSDSLYNVEGQLVESRRYHALPATGDGALGTNYDRSVYRYDAAGRKVRDIMVVSTQGDGVEQVTRYDYDSMGRNASTWTVVSPASHDMGAFYDNETNLSFAKVSETFYDQATPGTGVSGVGDGRVTASRSFFGTGGTDYVQSVMYYDWRGHLRGTATTPSGTPGGVDQAYAVQDVDRQGRTLASASYSAAPTWATVLGDEDFAQSVTTNRLSLSLSKHDAAGRVYRSETYAIDASGNAGGKLISDSYYDLAGNLVASTSPGSGGSEYAYDTAGRQYQSRTVTSLAATKYDANGNYQYRSPAPKADLATMSGGDDGVVALSHTLFDPTTERAIGSYSLQSNADDTDGLDLSSPPAADFTQSASFVWHDAAGRTAAAASYGSNDAFNNTWSYQALPARPATAPASSIAVPVVSYAYSEATYTTTVTDPAGKKSRTITDALGRTLYSVENYVNFSAAGGVGGESGTGGSSDAAGGKHADQDRVTRYAYNALGQQTSLTALDPDADGSLTDNQTTRYFYEDPYNASLVTGEIYPDSADTDSTGTDQFKVAYALDGQPTTRTDPRGVTLTFEYDGLRRPVEQDVALPTGPHEVDNAVLAVATGYDTRGRRVGTKNHTAASATPANVVKEVAYAYTDYSALGDEYQAVTGAATLTGPSASPSLGYAYDESVDGNNAYTRGLRLKGITYPNGRTLGIVYTGPGDTSGPADALSAPTALVEWVGGPTTGSPTRGTDDANVIASFDRTAGGTGTTVAKRYPTPGIELDFVSPGGGAGADASYASLDRHGRIQRLHWRDTSTGTPGDVFDIAYAYDINSNRTVAHNHRYGGDSHAYGYDDLDRLVEDTSGVLDAAAEDVPLTWQKGRSHWTLDALGNQLNLSRRGASNSRVMTHNQANEITSLAVRGDAPNAAFGDDFGSTAYADQWSPVGSENWSPPSGGSLTSPTPVADTLDGNTESEARALTLLGDDIGPHIAYMQMTFPSGATTGEAGYVFGYKSSDDYWLQVVNLGTGKLGWYHVVDGDKGAMLSSSNKLGGSLVWLTHAAKADVVGRWPWSWLPLDGSVLSGGYPSGRVGLYSNVAGVKFDFVGVWDEGTPQPSTPRWQTTQVFKPDRTADAMGYSATGWSSDSSYPLKGVRGERYQVTLNITRQNHALAGVVLGMDAGAVAGSGSHGPRLILRTDGAPDDGAQATNVTRNPAAVPSVASGTPLWFRVSSDGTTVTVRAATSEAGLATAAACFSGDFTLTGGGLALEPFSSGAGLIDDVTIRMDRDGNGSYETTELVERFTLDGDGLAQETLEYDRAGNLTYDGVFKYQYDAWNRMTRVTKAYRDDAGNVQTGSVLQENEYDGLGRRVVVRITNSGDLDCTQHLYYDGWSLVEVRNGSDITTSQYVWAGRVGGYIDELVQFAHNLDWPDAPGSDDTCETAYWAMQDANYNVLGVVDDAGKLVERYEYEPYGQRRVYISAGSNDLLATAGIERTKRLTLSDGSTATHGLNAFGHQGLQHDTASGLLQNRHRTLHAKMGMFMQRDPIGYIDGGSIYAAYHHLRSGLDPLGLATFTDENNAARSGGIGASGSAVGLASLLGWTVVDGVESVYEVRYKSNIDTLQDWAWWAIKVSPGTNTDGVRTVAKIELLLENEVFVDAFDSVADADYRIFRNNAGCACVEIALSIQPLDRYRVVRKGWSRYYHLNGRLANQPYNMKKFGKNVISSIPGPMAGALTHPLTAVAIATVERMIKEMEDKSSIHKVNTIESHQVRDRFRSREDYRYKASLPSRLSHLGPICFASQYASVVDWVLTNAGVRRR